MFITVSRKRSAKFFGSTKGRFVGRAMTDLRPLGKLGPGIPHKPKHGYSGLVLGIFMAGSAGAIYKAMFAVKCCTPGVAGAWRTSNRDLRVITFGYCPSIEAATPNAVRPRS